MWNEFSYVKIWKQTEISNNTPFIMKFNDIDNFISAYKIREV